MLKEFLNNVKNLNKVFILFHPDADGLTSALILKEAFKRINNQEVNIIYPQKGEGAYTSGTMSELNSINPEALAVLDLGISPLKLKRKIPVFFIDHHYIYEIPDGQNYISSFGDKIPRPTSMLTYESASRLIDIDDLLWLEAIGTIGDLGIDEPFHLFDRLPKDIHKKDLKEAQVLINAAKRSSRYDINTVLSLFNKINHPHQIVSGQFDETRKLQEMRKEVNDEWRKTRHIHPEFKWKVALIAFKNSCELCGLLASMWAEQLKDYVVIAANFGYIKDKVFYVIRTKSNIDVIKFMQKIKPENYKHPIVFGQRSAAGGSLDRNTWRRVVNKMGFK